MQRSEKFYHLENMLVLLIVSQVGQRDGVGTRNYSIISP